VSRYRGVFDALDKFLNKPDANGVTVDDIRRFTGALMTEGKMSPRTVRDVYKAAISSVYSWAIGNGTCACHVRAKVSLCVSSLMGFWCFPRAPPRQREDHQPSLKMEPNR
jgi:hypothetical protein